MEQGGQDGVAIVDKDGQQSPIDNDEPIDSTVETKKSKKHFTFKGRKWTTVRKRSPRKANTAAISRAKKSKTEQKARKHKSPAAACPQHKPPQPNDSPKDMEGASLKDALDLAKKNVAVVENALATAKEVEAALEALLGRSP